MNGCTGKNRASLSEATRSPRTSITYHLNQVILSNEQNICDSFTQLSNYLILQYIVSSLSNASMVVEEVVVVEELKSIMNLLIKDDGSRMIAGKLIRACTDSSLRYRRLDSYQIVVEYPIRKHSNHSLRILYELVY